MSYRHYGILKILRAYGTYILLWGLLCLFITLLAKTSGMAIWLQLILQAFFFSGLGFIAMAATHNAGFSLVVVIFYLFAFWLGRKVLPEALNIFMFNFDPLDVETLSLVLLPKTVLLCLPLWIAAQWLFADFGLFKRTNS